MIETTALKDNKELRASLPVNISTLFFIVGFFITFPLLFIPMGASNVRIEDLTVLLIFVIIIYKLKRHTHKVIFSVALLLCFFIISGLILRWFNSYNFNNYPLVRMIGLTLYFFVFSFYARDKEMESFLKGVIWGGAFTFVFLMISLFEHLASVGFNFASMYVMKDSLRGLSSFNPNTYGILAVLTSFASYYMYKTYNKKSYKLFAFFALCIPFIFLIRRDMLGIFCAVIFVFIITRSPKIKLIIYPLITAGFIALTVWLINLVQSLESLRFMAHRDKLYTVAFNAVVENKWGHGIGSEVDVLMENTGKTSVSHNSFLSMLIELGVFNTSIFLIFLIVIFFKIKEVWIKFFCVAFFVQSQFGNGFYFYKYHFLFLAIIIFLIAKNKRCLLDKHDTV